MGGVSKTEKYGPQWGEPEKSDQKSQKTGGPKKFLVVERSELV